MYPKPTQHVSEVESPDSTARLLPEESGERNRFQQDLYTWNSLLTDTWFPETVAMAFSVACFVAIVAIVRAFDGKPVPVFWRGVTLNAVVSVLGTASKCSLLYAMSQSIGQWKWVLLQTKKRRLRCVQTIDDASRGPWGSVTLLTRERCSVLWIGATVMVLALALDFSIQQIISHETERVQIPNGSAVAKQALRIDPTWYHKRFQNAMQAGFWHNHEPAPICSSGNCTWDSFTSIGFCNQCVDVTSESHLHHCTWTSQNVYDTYLKAHNSSGYNRAAQSDLQCNVTLSDGAISGVPIQIRFDADESGFVRLPKDIIWKITWLSQEQNAGINNHTMLFAHAELDVDTDMVFAHVELDSVTTPSDIVSIPEGKLKIKRVTSCAISFCARNYNISVSHGTPEITLTEPDWGRIFFDDGGVVCWTPDRALRKASTQEAPLPKPTHGSEYSICYVVPEPRLIYDNVVSGFSGQTFWEWSVGHLGGDWIFKDAGEQSVHNDDSIPMTSRIMELGFEEVTKNVAASLTKDILDNSTDTVNGRVFATEEHICFNSLWTIFPALVLTSGVAFYIATVWAGQLEGVGVWKASILPVLYHGIEPSISNGHRDLETVSKMGSVSQMTEVQLQSDDSRGGMVLR